MASATSNPAFRNSPAFSTPPRAQDRVTSSQLDELYGRPSATPNETERMTYEDTIVKIVISFVILLAGAVVGWIVPILAIPAAIVGLVLALVNTFKKKPSRGLILAYAAVEGVFVGGISYIFGTMFDDIVPQAVFGTLGVVAVTLALFASGKIRASKRATKIFLVAMIGYAVFSLVNVFIMIFGGANANPWGLRGDVTIAGIPLGVILGVFVVILAAYSLVLDFDFIQKGVQNKAPRKYGWTGAFGIMVTVIWLYMEILRMLAILRGND